MGGGFGAILFRWLIQHFRILFFDEGSSLLGFMGSYYVILVPVVGGLIIGLIGLNFSQIFGVGYEVIEDSINGKVALGVIILLIFLKILATSVTPKSGRSGGIFAPSLVIGALVGEAFGHLVNLILPSMNIPSGAFALAGMAAVYSGTAHAPISAILLLFEMIGNYKILPPLMITCVISAILVRWRLRYSIYTLKLLRKGIDIEEYKQLDLMETISVSYAMITDMITVLHSDTVRKTGLMIKSTNHRGFPVLDENGKLVGMITRKDINRAHVKGDDQSEIKKVMAKNLIVRYPNESLKTALHKMAEKNIGRIPVVERDHTDHIIGFVTRKSLISTYNREMENQKSRGGK